MFDFSEKDSCGVGFIASRNIPPTHGMTLKVLECLTNLDHRGAKFADGTGDGAGVLTEIPFELIRAELAELNIEHDTNKKIGIISCFFDPKNILFYWQSISFLIFFQNMEILIYSPNFYLHIQDAIVIVQYCIDGILEIASRFRI